MEDCIFPSLGKMDQGWLLELDGRFSGSIMEYWKHTHKLEGQNMKNRKFGSNRRH
ncbi:hypothetical protein HanRHA438_Chr07g0324881 [Helianthus annuus]|nr:hypothetical protein HanRHA438_Chr07g0324881 [Helianthus annuus]